MPTLKLRALPNKHSQPEHLAPVYLTKSSIFSAAKYAYTTLLQYEHNFQRNHRHRRPTDRFHTPVHILATFANTFVTVFINQLLPAQF